MKCTVRIANQSYEVEIEDIHARPIIAHVDGERFEVHPHNGDKPEISKKTKVSHASEAPSPAPVVISAGTSSNELTSPLPGTIVEVFVKHGDEVEVGKVILVIEAMKMKNSIRSTRSGKVAEMLVTAGQTVAHKQVLVRFE
jgi:biotin carboxyl carrier protein